MGSFKKDQNLIFKNDIVDDFNLIHVESRNAINNDLLITNLFTQDVVSNERKKDFQTFISKPLLYDSKYNQELIERIKNELPHLNFLFEALNTDGDGSIESHSLKVMEIFDEQSKFYKIRSFPSNKSKLKNLKGLLKSVIALHDIGKPLGRKNQHFFTEPILLHTLTQLGFTHYEVSLGQALVINEILGDLIIQSNYLKSTQSLELVNLISVAFEELKSKSKYLLISPTDYYKLLCNFYIADSNYYPSVQIFFSKDQAGKIEPKKKDNAYLTWKTLESIMFQFEKDPNFLNKNKISYFIKNLNPPQKNL